MNWKLNIQRTLLLCATLLAFLGPTDVHAQTVWNTSMVPHTFSFGGGHQYGGFGMAYRYRTPIRFEVGAGMGTSNNFNLTAMARYTPLPVIPVYVQFLAAPSLAGGYLGDPVGYGPAIGLHSIRNDRHLDINIGIGQSDEGTHPTFSAGIGWNYGSPIARNLSGREKLAYSKKCAHTPARSGCLEERTRLYASATCASRAGGSISERMDACTYIQDRYPTADVASDIRRLQGEQRELERRLAEQERARIEAERQARIRAEELERQRLAELERQRQLRIESIGNIKETATGAANHGVWGVAFVDLGCTELTEESGDEEVRGCEQKIAEYKDEVTRVNALIADIADASERSQAYPEWRKRFVRYGCHTQTVDQFMQGKVDEQKIERCQELKTGFVAYEKVKAREEYGRTTHCMNQCNPETSSGYDLRRAKEEVYDPCVARAGTLRMKSSDLACRERSTNACIDFCD